MRFIFGEYELDTRLYELRRSGEPCAIEPQVFDVLHYLVANRDRVVSKTELLDNVWGDRFVSESALTSRIKAARRALGDDGKTQGVIKTAHGRGYRFAVPVVERGDDGERGDGGEGGERDETTRSAQPVRPSPSWPLVGRRDELDLIAGWFGDPERGGVIVAGPAGVGKTRLADEVVTRAFEAGIRTARAAGHAEARSIPLAAFAHLVPVEAMRPTGADPAIDRATLFHRALASLRSDDGSRWLLFVDDVDQLDGLSKALLSSLITEQAVFAVTTLRASSADSTPLDHLVKDGQVVRVDLDPLTDSTIETMLHRALAGPMNAESLRQFSQAALGNPGIVRQLVESAIAAGTLSNRDGVWSLDGGLRPTPTLASVVTDRLTELEPNERSAMEVLAVAGELGLDAAIAVVGEHALDELEQRGLVVVRTNGRRNEVGLSHPLFGEVLRADIPALRSRRIRGRLADAICGLGARRRDDRIRVVAWRLDAGGRVDAAALLQAANLAMIDHDYDTAARLLDWSDDDDIALDVTLLRAELAFRREDFDAVERMLSAIDTAGLDDERRAQVARRRATNMFSRSMSARDASELLEQEITRVGDPAVRSKLAAQLAMLLANGGQVRDAIERAESALPSSSGEARVQLLRALGLALTHAARPLEGLERACEGQRLHAELEPDLALPGLGMLLFSEVVAYAAAGNVDAARAAAARVRQEHPTTVPNWIGTALGRLELMAGRTEAARRALAPVIHDARRRGNGSTERWVLALHASTHLIEGRPERAEPELARVRELEDGHRGLYHSEIDRAHAWHCAAQGNIDEAITRLRASAADCDERGALGMVSALLHDIARFGDPSSVVRRLTEIAECSDGVLFVARALYAAGLANRDPNGLARALDLFEEGGSGLYAAEAAAGLGDLLAAAGRDGEAAAAHERARAIRVIDGVRLDTPAMS